MGLKLKWSKFMNDKLSAFVKKLNEPKVRKAAVDAMKKKARSGKIDPRLSAAIKKLK